ncbi:hypothetical protein KIPB_004615, partial [Kipferlia bialata]|eukprot:g4615.t1
MYDTIRLLFQDLTYKVHPFRGNTAESLLCVFDGHGGKSTALAARDTMEGAVTAGFRRFESTHLRPPTTLEEYTGLFTEVFAGIQEAILATHTVNPEQPHVATPDDDGCAALVVYRTGNTLVTVSAGDCGAVLFTHTPSEAKLISATHSMTE